MQPGTIISHYRIVSPLGAGGMGQVWLAEDTQLERLVALKILYPKLGEDAVRLRRFEQEARAVAALNHPNIAHIHEFCDADGVQMLVMEYVDGISLAERIRGDRMLADEIARIGLQIADALVEAHSKGIVHRDIKPGNIMITKRGDVKVLDFGLAKFDRRETNPAEEIATEPLTVPGNVVGTLNYMSPEQCLGKEVDERTDIFSLGAVLYEMATSKRAFPGPTSAAVYDSVLNKTAPPPAQLNPSLPADLDRIITKSMEKDRELRYQTASDLRTDLRRMLRVNDPITSVVPAVAFRGRRAALAVVSVILAIALGAGTAWWVLGRRSAARTALAPMPMTSLPGTESQPSFSPEGNQVAFAWNSETENNWDIYVKVVDAGPPLRLTSESGTDSSPAWSPDGRHIAFLRESGDNAAFFLIPALGGMERKLCDASSRRTGLDAPFVAWSPDSKSLALSERATPDEPLAVWLHTLETGARRKVTSPPAKSLGDSSVVFSADGKRIAFVRTTGVAIQDVYVTPVEGGEPKRLTFDNRRIFGLTWNPADGKILFTSGRTGGSRLWRVSPNGGALEHITSIGEGASFLAFSRKGDRLAYTRSIVDTNIWQYDLGAQAPPVRLISSTRMEQGPQFSVDGQRVVFASNRSGSSEIWVCDKSGGNPTQLTNMNGPATGSPYWSPDGRQIVFDSRPDGNPDIYSVGLDGGAPVRLTNETSQEIVPTFSRDGRWIYFASNRSGRFEIWKIPPSGGAAVQVTHNGGFHGYESPDGKHFYYARAANEPGLWRLPLAGGEETPFLDSLRGGFWGYWSIVEQGVYYVERVETSEGGVQYFLRLVDFAESRDQRILAFDKRPFNAGLTISPAGNVALYTQVDQSDTDIMLVDGFR